MKRTSNESPNQSVWTNFKDLRHPCIAVKENRFKQQVPVESNWKKRRLDIFMQDSFRQFDDVYKNLID